MSHLVDLEVAHGHSPIVNSKASTQNRLRASLLHKPFSVIESLVWTVWREILVADLGQEKTCNCLKTWRPLDWWKTRRNMGIAILHGAPRFFFGLVLFIFQGSILKTLEVRDEE